MTKENQGRPLLWGGCFLLLLLSLVLVGGDLYQPQTIRLLQAVGIASAAPTQVLWEYVNLGDDTLLVADSVGQFLEWSAPEVAPVVTALTAQGEERWQRQLAFPGSVTARGAWWAFVNEAESKVRVYRAANGELAWQQAWTWPLQRVFLSPRGDLVGFLGPLTGEGGNLVEKLVFVNDQGRALWEYPVINGSLLDCTFDPEGRRLAVNQLSFHGGGVKSQVILFNEKGDVQTTFDLRPGELCFAATLASGGELWAVAAGKALYFLDGVGTVLSRRTFGQAIYGLQFLPGGAGIILVVTEGFSSTPATSTLTMLDIEGQVLWSHTFWATAGQLALATGPATVFVADGQGVYSVTLQGETRWFMPLAAVEDLRVDWEGRRLLAWQAGGAVTAVQFPWGE